jgi:hypothetical protein
LVSVRAWYGTGLVAVGCGLITIENGVLQFVGLAGCFIGGGLVLSAVRRRLHAGVTLRLNQDIVTRLAEQRIAYWVARGYEACRGLLDEKDVVTVLGEDGKRYAIESYGLEEDGDRVHFAVAVDDGGWSSFAPYTRDEVVNADGSAVPPGPPQGLAP